MLEFYVNYEDVKNAEISQEPIGALFVVYEKGLNDEEKLELNRKLYQIWSTNGFIRIEPKQHRIFKK